ncbi:DUF4007 family protein [Acidobacteria bacterium AH-259-O06]|nr:DUF4007 family protein [Acidobacteria bacterium AH-259-O06]
MAEKGKTGHRQRLRDRFLAGDAESRSDEMLLELLLTFATGRKDVMPLAQELIRVFGSLSQVLSASHDELCKVKGMGQSSTTLLKVVDFIQSGTTSTTTRPSLPKGAAGATQQKSFENLPVEQTPDQSSSNTVNKKPVESKEPSVSDKQPVKEDGTSTGSIVADIPTAPQRSSRSSKKQPAAKKSTRRKFQVSNGYFLEFDQLARILHFLMEHRDAKKINRKTLQEATGLADRQVESLVSMGAAMGLITPGRQVLTPVGLLIAEQDIFIEKRGSLEWCHYVGAGSFRNLIWFEIFNRLLAEASPMTQEEWNERMRSDLAGKYSKRTIGKGLYEEVRFVIDAYMERNFSKLELLHRSSDERLYRRRYTQFAPLVLSAMIYDFCATKETHLSQVGEMAVTPGSPAVVFGLDAASFRQQIEGLHDRGWLRYETTHNLDQVRLKPGFSALEFLTAHFEDREPREDSKPSPGGIFQ